MCLSKSAESRKYAISLGSLEYSGDLAKQMMAFSGKLEKIYKILQDLTKRKVNCEEQYEKHFATIDDKLNWFEGAEARFAFFKVFLMTSRNIFSKVKNKTSVSSLDFKALVFRCRPLPKPC